MEENVVSEGSSTTSIQHEIRNDISNNEVAVPNNLLNNLVENLEEFEERMSFDIEKVYKKFEEKIGSQSNLIESLRARIEYLEIDSAAKDEDIKKLRHDIHESVLTTRTQNTVNENELNVQFTEPLNAESHDNIQNRSETTFECKKCGKKLKNFVKYNNHIRETHHKYKCIVCQQMFPSKKSRRKHMRKKHKKEFACNLCTRKFYFITGLREHFRAKHSGGNFFPKATRSSNPPPTSSTTSSSAVVDFIHEILPYQSPSNKTPPYQLKCKICKEKFDTHAKFNAHAKSLHDCKFTCPDCSRVFLTKATRRSHVRQKYRCQVCDKSVISEGGLISHCRQKHEHMSIVEIYCAAMKIQLYTSQNQIITPNELEITYEEGSEGDNGSFDNDHTNEEYNNDDYSEESGDTEDENDYSEEENERSDYDDYTEEENEKSDDNNRGF